MAAVVEALLSEVVALIAADVARDGLLESSPDSVLAVVAVVVAAAGV